MTLLNLRSILRSRECLLASEGAFFSPLSHQYPEIHVFHSTPFAGMGMTWDDAQELLAPLSTPFKSPQAPPAK